ncbi:hypothetical protein [Bradyrhizobium cosmicum]|uniref:Uncharacterized protein n=1 Tax=Bradyrhizobium cosmicum TaxID=1404864 RepID=A0AAI8MI38_9BRAD|nr:hypothetical protein [Bradyrhizobium cosmicum]BAL78857.1 hypothetical protein S23_56650 [Bradyrhizobium cosmicum]
MPQSKLIVAGRKWSVRIVASVALFCSVTSVAHAQCVERSERVSKIAIDAFIAEPSSLLNQLRNEKEKLSGRLQGYLLTDVSVLKSVQSLTRAATQADRASIGAALHRAEIRCRASKPEIARKISDFVARMHDSAVLAGYSSEPDDIPPPSATTANVASPGTGLMSGEYKTDLADPFASMPLPE